MKTSYILCLMAGVATLAMAHTASAAISRQDTAKPNPIHITVPVVLQHADVVFNMDHLAFTAKKMPVGMLYMHLLALRMKQNHTPGHIIGVFHGLAAYMLLNDAAYNEFRGVTTGNPYAKTVAMLQKQGVDTEECAFSMSVHRWGNKDLLPGVQVTTGAVGRIVELTQQGYVQIQP
jgi:intracellular sulfur oxidation DsrE/DsrF family protein